MRGENWRFWTPVVLLGALAVYSGQKLVHSHLDPQVAAPRYVFEYPLPAVRGSIYSSYGKGYPFVRSVPVWEYSLDPVSLTNRVVRRKGEPPRPKAAILKTIADTLGLDYAKVKKMADSPKRSGYRSQFLCRSSDDDAHRVIANSKLVSGVAIKDCQVREYLHGRSLCHVLGAINAERVGSAGLELKYDRELSGKAGTIRGMRDARGNELYDRRMISIDPIDGEDIFLTIDHNIQFEAELALKWGLKEYGAASGWCIVMDSSTGAILAMASLPDFHPDRFGRASASDTMNRAIAFNYEPGSVMKVITAATAIDAKPNLYGPRTIFNTDRYDQRYYKLPGDGSHKWEKTMTLEDAIVHSSNIVIGKLAYDLGPLLLHDYMRKFGFGQKTGIDLPGEQYGILKNPRKQMWDKASWSRAGIGQAVSVTGIQLISAYQTIANNGLRMKPYIIDHIDGANGNVHYRHKPEIAARVISAKTARTLRKMMLGVASPAGTARRAAIRGYSVAGKTGTAQKAENGHYVDGLYRASFCGIVPASDPRIVILTTLDFEQRTKFHQGGNSAGPVFKRIALAAIRYLGIQPDRPEELEESDDEDEYDRIVSERLQEAL